MILFGHRLLDTPNFLTIIGKHSALGLTSHRFLTDAPVIDNSVVFQYFVVRQKKAFILPILGDFIDADTAVRYGLINHAVAAEELDDAVMALADKICAKSQMAIRLGKDMFYAQIEKDVQGAYQYAATKMVCNMMTEDAGEGIDAFMQKRKPDWKGR